MTVRIGVVGAGAQGEKHISKLPRIAGCTLAGIHDRDRGVAERAGARAGAPVFAELDGLAAAVDAAVVAVPTAEHAEVGLRLLERGVDLLIEKPLAASRADGEALVAAAEAAGRVLAVGHSEFYNPAVRALLESAPEPGFLEIHRLAAFVERSLDIDVVLDLMIHDLQILHALDGSEVVELRASGIHVLSDRIDLANVRLELASGCVANLTASRVSQETIRKLRLFSRAGAYYSLDYAERRVQVRRLERVGDRPSLVEDDLEVEARDALEDELGAFAAACRGEPARLVDGRRALGALDTALNVIAALERQGEKTR